MAITPLLAAQHARWRNHADARKDATDAEVKFGPCARGRACQNPPTRMAISIANTKAEIARWT